ncbi:MAG: putative rane protein, partial [Proteobacteria bacterium]|nr:putative rane protein [Pseudomonadota bacterium]
AIEYEEFINIRKDIGLVIVTAAGLIAALILLVVRSLRWAVLIFVPMGLGVLWSLGLALITVGHLTIITAAFIAILFGLGADYGIFTSSRIAEERRAGKPLVEAIGAGIGASFVAVLTAGGASVLIFGALATVDFPGFAELGVVAAKGVLMILISTWTVQPALYVLLPPKLKSRPLANTGGSGLRVSGAYPRPVAAMLVVAALGCAAFGVIKGISIPFDYDVLSMLPKDSQAAHYQRRMVAESDYQAEVVIFTAKDIAQARRITAEAGNFKSIAKVQSLSMLFPDDADDRLRKALAIGESAARPGYSQRLAELDRAGLSEKSFGLVKSVMQNVFPLIDEAQEQAFSAGHATLVKNLEALRANLEAIQAKLERNPELGKTRSEMFLRALLDGANVGLNQLASWRQAKPLTPEFVPPALRERFFGADGSVAVYAFPAKSVYEPDNLDQLMRDVYSVSPDATGFPTTHQAFARSVVESFSRGTMLALGICLLWILLVTRSLIGFTLASLPLLIGGGWMLGLMELTGIRYNYANIVALPLMIALAVDYGVWFSYRWSELQDQTPFQVSLAAGKVIGLAAGTELAGLGAVTLASYRGVSTLGASITIGLACCLTATLFVAPAIGQLLDSKRNT